MYKRIGLMMVGTALALTVTACGTDRNNNELGRQADGMRTQSTQQGSNVVGKNQNADHNNNMLNDRGMVNDPGMINDRGVINDRDGNEQHRKLLEQVRKVNGVQDATVFVSGDDIVVGLDVQDNNNGAVVEKRVKQALQKTHPGYNVHVTSDHGMHNRIREIQGQMMPMDGQPIRNMANDVADLLEDMGRAVTEPFR